MTNEQENDKEKPSPADRLDEIKKEAQEDASSYYTQGKSEDDTMTEEDFNKAVLPVNAEKEEMNLMKALAYLGFGMGALAIIVILFFLRNLDHKVGDMDAAVGTLEQKFGPLKEEVEQGFAQVNADVSQLKSRFGNFERQAAVTELKRAQVAIQTVTANTSPEVQAKSNQVLASIDNLLQELEPGSPGTEPPVPAPATATPAPADKPFEIILEQPATEPAPMAEAHPPEEPVLEAAPAEPAVEESPAPVEEPAAEESTGGGDESGDEEEDEEEDDE